MNIKTKTIIAGTLLTALFAGQSAYAGQDKDQGIYAELSANSQTVMTDKIRYDAPTFENDTTVVSGRK